MVISELRILPPLAIARFGSSPEVMDNYDLVTPDDGGFRRVVPAPTLVVDPVTGAISGETVPTAVRFRDGTGRVRPVAPFFEVWARVDDDEDLVPLTTAHLAELGLDPSAVQWRVEAVNRKAARRTGSDDDAIRADVGPFGDHGEHVLVARANNFKADRTISFGTVRYIRPTEAFPEIRFRFVPGGGYVFGADEGDPLTREAVYDSTRGTWDDHWDGDPNAPLVTFPAQTYQGKLQPLTGRYVSDGYVDDTCDGIVSVELGTASGTLTAMARFASGVPDFAPDSLHVRTLADDLEQASEGPEAATPLDRASVEDTLRRAMETVRLMNTMVMNADQGVGGVQTNAANQAGHEAGEFERAFEPVFGQGGAPYHEALEQHLALLASWADGVLPVARNLLRSYEEAADLSNLARRKMPALMRGSDMLELTLTRRQIDTLRRAALETQAGAGPETAMLQLIEFFRSMGPLHQHIDADGRPLSTLFSTPAALVAYLRSAVAKGPQAGADAGGPLVVPGDPDGSAFVRLLRRQDHPMHGPFSQVVPGTNKPALQIVEEWIASLPPEA